MNKLKKLNLKDIIDVLCHYDYRKTDFPHNKLAEYSDEIPHIYGLADDIKKEILIDKETPLDAMRETIIHELYHCYHYLKGDLCNKKYNEIEKIVEKESKALIKELYK